MLRYWLLRNCFQDQSIRYCVGKNCSSVISYGSNVLEELVVVWLGLSVLVKRYGIVGIGATTQEHFGRFQLSSMMANSVKMDDFLAFRTH